MKTKYLVGLFACLSIMMTACGSSSSNDDGNTQLKTEDEAFDSFCLNFPQSTACQDIQQEGDDMGFDDYFGGQDDLYGDSSYGNAGGFCGCPDGLTPIIYRGQRMCERQQQRTYQREEVRLRYQRRGNDERVGAYYDYVDERETESIYEPVGDNCYQNAGVRCNPRYGHRDCNIRDNYGNSINAACVRVQGTNYGYCQEQVIVNR